MNEVNDSEALEKKGVKPTANRILVLRAMIAAGRPVSLTELETIMETMDKSSIFRVLNLFVERHVVHAIEDGSGSVKYELCGGKYEHSVQDMHPHFYCEQCHRTFCMQSVTIPSVEVPRGYVVNSVNYVLKGVCSDCAKKQHPVR